MTQSGAIVGTPAYMAPEQARGNGAEIGPAADVYALGAILYELLSGRPPFQGTTSLETLLQVVQQEPVPVARLVAQVPRDLDTICSKCLEKDPRRRYPTAAELADDLERFLKHEPIRARPVGVAGRLARWGRRNPPLAGLLSALLVTGLVAFVAILWQWREAEQARQAADALARSEAAAKVSAQDQRTAAENARRRAEHAYGRELLDRALALCAREEIGPGLLWLVRGLEQAKAAGDPDLTRAFRANIAAWAGRLLVPSASPSLAGPVTALAFRSDGRRLLTGQWANRDNESGPGEARLWDPETWQPLGLPMQHPGPVTAAVFSPDGRQVLTAGLDGIIHSWDGDTGHPVGEPFQVAGQVWAAVYSPDGKVIATAGGVTGATGEARVWDAVTGRPVTPPLRHPGLVRAAVFSPDGKALLTGCASTGGTGKGAGGEARLWDLDTGQHVGPVLMHSDEVTTVAFSPDGRTIVTGSRDGLVRRWDRNAGQQVGTPLRHSSAVLAAVFSPDGRTLLTGSGDRDRPNEPEAAARLWDLTTGKLLAGPWPHPDLVSAVAFRPDGRAFATGCQDGAARRWALGAFHPSHSWRLSGPVTAAFSRDGRYLIAGGGTAGGTGEALLLEVATGHPVGAALKHSAPVQCVVFSPDGMTAATSAADGTARLWSVATGQPLSPSLPLGSRAGTVMSFNPDGRILATCGYGGPARLWETATGQPIDPPLTEDNYTRVAVVSPDGRTLAAAIKGGVICLWDLTARRVQARFRDEGGETKALAFSPDGRTLLVGGSDATARLLEATTGRPLGKLGVPGEAVWVVRFSPDGTRLLTITGTNDRDRTRGLVRVWDTRTRWPLGPPLPHRVGAATAAAFHPGGRLVATGGWEGDIRLWDAVTGRPVGPPFVETGPIQVVAFSPDGTNLAAAGQDGTLALWRVPAVIEGDPKRVRLWVESITGQELDPRGAVRPLTDRDACREALRRLGGPPTSSPG